MTPDVSVVIATRNREARLKRQLDSLRAQSLGTGRFEVIVVDDGSDDGTPALLAAEQAAGALALQVVRREVSGGPAGARNAGWRAARAPLIAFTDDDCVSSPGWLAAGLAAWGGDPDAFVQGATTPQPEELENLWPFGYTIDITELSLQFETCNIFYPRALLERLGGFDESFTGAQGEDIDLGWRAIEAGATPRFAPEAAATHAVVAVGPRVVLRRAWSWRFVPRALVGHPELLRRKLLFGVFWSWSHYLLARGVAALPFARRRWGWPLAWWLGRPFLAEEAARARKGGTLALVPFWIAHDVVETAGIVQGAVRHRLPII